MLLCITTNHYLLVISQCLTQWHLVVSKGRATEFTPLRIWSTSAIWILACWRKLLERLPISLNVYKWCSAINFFFFFLAILQSCQNEESQMYKSQLGSHYSRWNKVQRRYMCSLLHAFTLHLVMSGCARLRVTSSSQILSLSQLFQAKWAFQKCKKFNTTSRSSNPTIWQSSLSSQLLASCIGNGVFMGGVYVSVLNPAKLGVRLVVGEGDVVVVGCAAAKGCVRAIY